MATVEEEALAEQEVPENYMHEVEAAYLSDAH